MLLHFISSLMNGRRVTGAGCDRVFVFVVNSYVAGGVWVESTIFANSALDGI